MKSSGRLRCHCPLPYLELSVRPPVLYSLPPKWLLSLVFLKWFTKWMLLEGLEARSNKDGPLEDLSLMCYLTEFIDPIELFLN